MSMLRPANAQDWPHIEALLKANQLPVEGARQHLAAGNGSARGRHRRSDPRDPARAAGTGIDDGCRVVGAAYWPAEAQPSVNLN